MKEACIIVFLIIIVIFGGIAVEKYLTKTSMELVIEIEKLENEINNNKDINENEIILNTITNIENKWDEVEKKWATIVEHIEIDNLEIALLQIKQYIKANDKTEALVKIQETKFLLNHIPEKEKINFKNIM